MDPWVVVGRDGPAPTPQVSALLVFLCQLPVHFSLDLGQLQLDPQSLGLLQLQGPLGYRVGSGSGGPDCVSREVGGQGISGSVSAQHLWSAPDLSLLQCSLDFTLLPFQSLLGFLQLLDALPAEADLVCELTDLLCKVDRALRDHPHGSCSKPCHFTHP